jgi:hypothetical protein
MEFYRYLVQSIYNMLLKHGAPHHYRLSCIKRIKIISKRVALGDFSFLVWLNLFWKQELTKLHSTRVIGKCLFANRDSNNTGVF